MLTVVWFVFAVAAVTNWWGVASGRRPVVLVAKPAALIALVGVALAGGAAGTTPGRWLLAGLVLCLAGDVFLLSATETAFLGGLSSFLLGHLAYVVVFVTVGLSEPAWGLIGLMALIAVLIATRHVIPAAHREGGAFLAGAVAAYMLVIGAMVITAWMTGQWLIGLGAVTFMVSDAILAIAKFVRRRRHADLAVMVTYHLGQALLAAGVLAAL
ncbi:MAG: lysoplasmalogenase [Dermatophilaceae bacterium]|nr:lysoplasmalogenase [Intrasporangiaceae bacterium]